MSYIFLEQSLYSRSPNAGNRCKVIFSSPKHSLSPREVQATVKNPFTIKVRVPHCPSKICNSHVLMSYIMFAYLNLFWHSKSLTDTVGFFSQS